jgi:3,4-dihydroxy 2-butanone 4-phosphate synthase/GTP cyclohydrolase II
MPPKSDLERQVSARIPTHSGEFHMHLYLGNDDKEHLALVLGDVAGEKDVLVRVHSECLTGDVFGSQRCDCGEQLDRSLAMIAQEGAGVLIYLRQEGRGIGLLDKLRAYNLQDEGLDTIEANIALGHQADARDYGLAVQILDDLGVESLRLLTNNPKKIEELQALGIQVTERVPLQGAVNPENARYLLTKAARMQHMLDLPLSESDPPASGNGAA